MAVPVLDYPAYFVYEDGRIWSTKTNKFLRPATNSGGYKSVELFNENGSKRLLIHRIVAKAFIPNPLDLPQINHIDENPANNAVSNLEWCSAEYNMNYGVGRQTRHLKIDYSTQARKNLARENGKKASVGVAMFTKDGRLLKSFHSGKEASLKTGIQQSNILRAAKGERKTAGGFIWKKIERSDDLSVFQC